MAEVRERASRVALLVAIVLFAVGVGSGARVAHADDAQKARELFTQGNTYFDLGQFDKAIDAWQGGYQLKNDPGFLYNIAQAYRTMGDAQKAIFFYKRYLSNSPKAHNRSEVEQKIEALQKQLSLQEQAKGLPPPGPFGPDNPANATNAGVSGAPTPTEPAPAAGSTSDSANGATEPSVTAADGQAGPGGPGTAGARGVVEPGLLAPGAPPPHRIDLRAAVGFDTWSSGLQDHADPSFAFTLAGGYTFGGPQREVRFRLGALFGYTFLKETDSKDGFTSLVVDPTILIRGTPRFQLMADVGIGFLSISGITKNSALLASPNVNVNGSPALFLLRVGAGAEYDVIPNLSLFVWPALATSPKKKLFYSDITRFELLAGVAYRL